MQWDGWQHCEARLFGCGDAAGTEHRNVESSSAPQVWRATLSPASTTTQDGEIAADAGVAGVQAGESPPPLAQMHSAVPKGGSPGEYNDNGSDETPYWSELPEARLASVTSEMQQCPAGGAPTTGSSAGSVARGGVSRSRRFAMAKQRFVRRMRRRAELVTFKSQAATVRNKAYALRWVLDLTLFVLPPAIVMLALVWVVWNLMTADSVTTNNCVTRVLLPIFVICVTILASCSAHVAVEHVSPVGRPGSTVLAGQATANELSIPWFVSRMVEHSIEFDWSWDTGNSVVVLHAVYCPGGLQRSLLFEAALLLFMCQIALMLPTAATSPTDKHAAASTDMYTATALWVRLLPVMLMTILSFTVLPGAIVPAGWRVYTYPRIRTIRKVRACIRQAC